LSNNENNKVLLLFEENIFKAEKTLQLNDLYGRRNMALNARNNYKRIGIKISRFFYLAILLFPAI
jgi:hypothetical protein